jgi:NADPH:quinone reductase-like Zn-dependent oxidoreductase
VPPDPVVPGSDGAGTVVGVGSGVDRAWVGRDVVINPSLGFGDDLRGQGPDFQILGSPDNGTYAELVAVPAANVHPKPDGLSFEEAAALPLAGLTAYRAVMTRAGAGPDDLVVVTGIGGGVALFALAIARLQGARVVVTSSSEAKRARARELGAEGGVSYRDPDWTAALLALTGGRAPSVVIDGSGGEPLVQLLDVVATGARVVNYGGTAGPLPALVPRVLFWKQLNLLGSTMGSPQEFAGMLEMARARGLRPVIDRTFPLAEAAEAHRRMERSEHFGKIVLSIA